MPVMRKLYYGAAYYPELWDKKTVDQDITLMRAAGINNGEDIWANARCHRMATGQ
jgi:beta-galactosidase